MTPLAAKGRGKDGQKPRNQPRVFGRMCIIDMHTASSSAGKIAL